MARILLLISLALLIGIALSVPSNHEKVKSNEKKKAASKSKSNDKSSGSASHEKDVGSHEKHKKHKSVKSDEKRDSASHEDHDKHGDHKKHESHEKHDKHKKHDDKHRKHNKHSSRSSKHHRKQSSRRQQEKKSDTTNGTREIIDADDVGWEYENRTAVDTRRILYGKNTPQGKRPYMIYLQLTKESAKAHKYRGWLCGGIIVERYYVLTSAACVEDAEHFYVVSGTSKFIDSFDYKDDKCVCNNRRKVVWKCIPKNYKFDFQDSVKWSSNDIAIVKVNKPFKFGVIEKDCEYAADLISYNNISRELEKPGTKGWIIGWGSGSNFREGVYRRQKTAHIPDNSKCLQEARVCIMDNEKCAKKWSQRFRSIISQYMICTKDIMKKLSEICDKRYANCTDVEDSRRIGDPREIEQSKRADEIDLGRHLQDPDDYTARRSSQGGFCENDHGGPLIVKYQNKDRVIGVISACKIDPKSHSCHGPFLYTSVFKNRQFISCSIYKDTEETCRRVFRTGITHEEWTVDWDNVKEDDDDRNDSSDEKAENEDRDSDASAAESAESLREAKANRESKSSSSSSESKEKKTGKSKEKSNDKSSEKKDSDSDEKKSKKDKDAKALRDASDSSDSSEERRRVKRDSKDVFYESSRDENVNEPGSSE